MFLKYNMEQWIINEDKSIYFKKYFQYSMATDECHIAYLEVAKRRDLKSSHHTQKKSVTMQVTDANQSYCGDHFAMIQILNYCVAHLKLI